MFHVVFVNVRSILPEISNNCFERNALSRLRLRDPIFFAQKMSSSGDWICTCGEKNFGRRDICRRCHLPRASNNNNNNNNVSSVNKVSSSRVESNAGSAGAVPPAPKSKDRSWLDYMLYKGNKSDISDARVARRFLLSLVEYGDSNAVELLERLTTSSSALESLQAALSMDDSAQFYQECIIPLFRLLGKDELSIGPRKR